MQIEISDLKSAIHNSNQDEIDRAMGRLIKVSLSQNESSILIDAVHLKSKATLNFENTDVLLIFTNFRFAPGADLHIIGSLKSGIEFRNSGDHASVSVTFTSSQTAGFKFEGSRRTGLFEFKKLFIIGSSTKTEIDIISVNTNQTGTNFASLVLTDLILNELGFHKVSAPQISELKIRACDFKQDFTPWTNKFQINTLNECRFHLNLTFPPGDGNSIEISNCAITGILRGEGITFLKFALEKTTFSTADLSNSRFKNGLLASGIFGQSLRLNRAVFEKRSKIDGFRPLSSTDGSTEFRGSRLDLHGAKVTTSLRLSNMKLSMLRMSQSISDETHGSFTINNSEIKICNLEGRTFNQIEFEKCKFDRFKAKNTNFNGQTIFRSNVFDSPPKFYGASFNSDTSFMGDTFKNTNSDSIGAYRHLKKLMGEIGNEVDEHRFAGYELACRSKHLNWKKDFIEKILLSGYKLLNDYGRSPFKPLLLLVVMFFSMWFIYWFGEGIRIGSDPIPWDGSILDNERWEWSGFFSLFQTISPLKLLAPTKLFVPASPTWFIISLLHSIFGTVFWVFAILGIRRRFRAN